MSTLEISDFKAEIPQKFYELLGYFQYVDFLSSPLLLLYYFHTANLRPQLAYHLEQALHKNIGKLRPVIPLVATFDYAHLITITPLVKIACVALHSRVVEVTTTYHY
jgi:hypothetical protein